MEEQLKKLEETLKAWGKKVDELGKDLEKMKKFIADNFPEPDDLDDLYNDLNEADR